MAPPKVRDTYQKEYWEAHAHGRKWDHPVVAFFVRQRLAYLDRFMDWSKVGKFLDVGCGYGITMHYVKDRTRFRVGVDGSWAMLSGCPRDTASFVQAHVGRLPFPDNAFDCVFAWEILHHIEKPLEAVREFVRVSRRYVVLCEPNKYNPAQYLFGLLVPSERGTLSFSKSKLTELMHLSGITFLHGATVGCIFPNRMPLFWLPVFRVIPFPLPGIGISSLAVGLKPNAG
jgi:SAM-dependent methyltransferase